MLLWRMSTYYIPVIAGALIFIFFKNHSDHEKELARSRKTDSLAKREKTDAGSAAASADARPDQSVPITEKRKTPEPVDQPPFGSQQIVKGLSL